MDALNHADQMRLANLINDNSDDAEIQKKLDQVVELTSSTRDQAAVALHDCHYDVEKAVDMILEGDQAIVDNQWKSAGKKKNKNLASQAAKSVPGSNKNAGQANRGNHPATSVTTNTVTTVGPYSGGTTSGGNNKDLHHSQQHHNQAHHHHQSNRGINQPNAATQSATSNQFSSSSNKHNNSNTSNTKQDASDSLKNIVGVSASNLMTSSDSTTTSSTAATSTKVSSMQQPHQPQQQQQQQQPRQKTNMQIGSRQNHQRSTKIPDSAVEMPNNELQETSLNVQFGELDLGDGTTGAYDNKGTFQDVLESNRLSRQSGLPNSQSTIPSHDSRSNRQLPQQHLGKGGPRRNYNNNNNDDRRFYNNSNRGGRQIPGNPRQYNNPRPSYMNNNSSNNNSSRVRTILNRGLQPNSTLSTSSSSQQMSGFPNSIDTWTNSTAEAATKTTSTDQAAGAGSTLRVGQWSDVAGNEDWSEEEHWDAKVMETKVFTPSSKAVDVPAGGHKNPSLLTDTSGASQMNLSSKLSDATRDDVNSQSSNLNTVSQPVVQSQQTSQKPISHMNDIFDPSVAKAVRDQQNLAAINPKTSMGIGQYSSKDVSDAKTVLDSQNLSSIKPKTTTSMNQYNKEASESLKSLVGISSSGAKGGVPSVPPGALPLMSQPQYIMGNAYQPAIFPYAYQAPDVHYPVAAPTGGREQNFQSVYTTSDGNKFNRGADGDAPSISTSQTAPSQTHNQAFVANALHAGYQLTYAMPGAFNMMPQNLYSAAPIFPHMPQPTNTGSANTVYQKNTPASYQHHTGYSGYDQLNPLIDYVKQQNYSGSNMQHQQPTGKSSGGNSELDVTAGGNSHNMYGAVNKSQVQPNKQQSNYNDVKGYQQQQQQQQQMSNNGPHQFGFSHNAQQPTSIAGYPLLQAHNLDNSNLHSQGSAQSQIQHSSVQRGGAQVNPSKYYWN